MTILPMYPTSINEKYMELVINTLRDGGIIIYPTDSLYAIGCNALNNQAIERICHIKGINPAKTNLSIICHDISPSAEYARIDNRAFRIMKDNLPGPFTFLLPASTTLPKVFKGRKTVGVRIPDNAIAREIAMRMDSPLLTTSIQWDTEDEAINPESIAMRYSDTVDIVIDGGEGGTEPSTVIDITDSSNPEIIRPGLGEIEL